MVQPSKDVRGSVKLKPELHRELAIECASTRESMNDLIERLYLESKRRSGSAIDALPPEERDLVTALLRAMKHADGYSRMLVTFAKEWARANPAPPRGGENDSKKDRRTGS